MTQPADDAPSARIVYRNHRGEVSEREIVPVKVEFGTWPDHGPDPCWMLSAWCRTKQAPRHFKMANILDWRDL